MECWHEKWGHFCRLPSSLALKESMSCSFFHSLHWEAWSKEVEEEEDTFRSGRDQQSP